MENGNGKMSDITDWGDFDLDTWNKEIETDEIPDWVEAGLERELYDKLIELYNDRKNVIKKSQKPHELKKMAYQVKNAHIADALGRCRSTIKRQVFPKLVEHIRKINVSLEHYLKVEDTLARQRIGHKNKNELKIGYDKLKAENAMLKERLLRDVTESIFSDRPEVSTDKLTRKILDQKEEIAELQAKNARIIKLYNDRFDITFNDNAGD